MSIYKLRLVIPTYNRPVRLIKLLNSIHQASMHPSIEVVVVDDFSDKVNRQIVQHEAAARKHIKFIFSLKNKGGAKSRNVGALTGSDQVTWLWFIDDDDIVSSNTILDTFHFLSTHPEHNLYLMQANYHTMSGITTRNPKGENLFKRYSRYGNDVNTSCAVFSYKLFKKLEGWDEHLVAGQDTDLLLRASEITDAMIIPHCSVDVIQHNEDRITTNPKKQMIGKIQFIRKNYSRLHPLRLSRYLFTTVVFYPYLRRILKK